MGSRPPKTLSATAVARCASIASIQRRDIFDPQLGKLVAGACRWHEQHQQAIAARTSIVRAGRVFAKALRTAPAQERRPFEIVLPYGSSWLGVTLDARPSPQLARNKQFVILLCALVDKAGGRLTHNERTGEGSLVDLLDALKPHLPLGYVPASANTLRRLKESAAHLSRHYRQ
jgi:hypothetical protein